MKVRTADSAPPLPDAIMFALGPHGIEAAVMARKQEGAKAEHVSGLAHEAERRPPTRTPGLRLLRLSAIGRIERSTDGGNVKSCVSGGRG
jgi:hypothetical protein